MLILHSIGYILANHYDLLEVPKDAQNKDIKKAYRRLALELHPDKLLQQNFSVEEMENKTHHFILVQEAYETLSDERKRYVYDSSLSGVNTDIMDTEPEAHTLFPYQLLVRTRRLSLHLDALFPQKSLPDIEMDVLVSVTSTFTGLRGNHSYHRQVECPGCEGNGGDQGASRTCSFCEGKGHARHLLCDKNRSYLHVASTTCHVCGGKGVHPLGSCTQCRGRGFVLQEEMVYYDLPPGWPHRYQLQYISRGHQRRRGGSVGGVLLTFLYDFPPGWSLAEGSGGTGDLLVKVDVPVQRYTEGFTEHITTLDGRETEVHVDRVSDVLSVTEATYVKKGYGLPRGVGLQERGDLYVSLEPRWDDTPPSVWEHFLQEMIKADNSTHSYEKMMNLFRLFGARKGRRGREKVQRAASKGKEGEGVTLEDS